MSMSASPYSLVPKTVRISVEEIQIANLLNMSITDYARAKAGLDRLSGPRKESRTGAISDYGFGGW